MNGDRLTILVAAIFFCCGAARADRLFDRWETLGHTRGLPSDKVFAVTIDGPRVWAGTEEGLALLDKRTGKVERIYDADGGLPFPAVTALARGRGGEIWVGTMGGLARVSAGRVDSFTQLDSGLANNVIYGVAVDGNDVWIATAAGLNRFDPRSDLWEIFDTTNTLMHEPWTYAVTASRGSVYVAVWGGGVLVHDRATGAFREHRDPDGEMEVDLFRDDGLVHDVTSSIAVDGDVMWAGTYFGLSRYDGRRWRSFSEQDSGLAGDFINFLRAGPGVVWIGTDQGLSRFDSTTWHTWRVHEAGRFELIVTDSDGRTQTQQPATGPPSNTIYGIDIDGNDIWLATASGLSHAIAAQPPVPQGERR